MSGAPRQAPRLVAQMSAVCEPERQKWLREAGSEISEGNQPLEPFVSKKRLKELEASVDKLKADIPKDLRLLRRKEVIKPWAGQAEREPSYGNLYAAQRAVYDKVLPYVEILHSSSDGKPPPGSNIPVGLRVLACPGAGKTFLAQTMKREFHKKFGEGTVVFTAHTGSAATLVERGVTVCTAFSIDPFASFTSRFKPLSSMKRNEMQEKYMNAKVFFIDEISMVEPWMLSMVDQRLKEIRYGEDYEQLAKADKCTMLPFGGYCVILTGDVWQIPPIGTSLLNEVKRGKKSGPGDIAMFRHNLVGQKIFMDALGFTLNEIRRQGPDKDEVQIAAVSKHFRTFDEGSWVDRLNYLNGREHADGNDMLAWDVPIVTTDNLTRHVINDYRGKLFATQKGTTVVRWVHDIKWGAHSFLTNEQKRALY
eukprot:gene21181-7986_t